MNLCMFFTLLFIYAVGFGTGYYAGSQRDAKTMEK
jgi:hypothetical protein